MRFILLGLLCPIMAWAAPTGVVDLGLGKGTAGVMPNGWHQYVTFPGKAVSSLDRAVIVGGQPALRVQVAANTRCAISRPWPLTGTGSYTFGCRVRGTGQVLVQARLQWFQTLTPLRLRLVSEDAPSPAVTVSNEWTEIAATGSKPEEADLALVVIIVGSNQTPAGSVWLTEATLRPGAYPVPLVANPSFEQGGEQPLSWGPSIYGGGFELKRDETVAHTGKASIRLTGLKNHGDRACYYQATALFTPPQRVRLSFWYKGSGRSTAIMHLLMPAGVKRADGTIDYGTIDATCDPTDEWKQFSQEIVVPDEARKAGVMRIDIILYQRGEGTLWYDDVKVDLLQ